jgi:hypothetical protein
MLDISVLPGICKPPPHFFSGDSCAPGQPTRAKKSNSSSGMVGNSGGCRMPDEVLDIQNVGNLDHIPIVLSGRVALQIGPGIRVYL